MRRTTRLAGAATAAALLLAPVPASAAAPAAPRLELPAPTGPNPVGTGSLHLRDESRPDPWVPTGARELMITVWYPAAEAVGEPARYLSPAESRLFLELQAEHGTPPVDDPEVLSTVATHAKVDAPPQRTPDGHPLVVLSPGFSFPRATMSGMAEDLASRGYVVAAIGHDHEAAGIEFPDGHVTECDACETADLAGVVRGRSLDVRFFLDEFLEDPRFGPLVDPDSIGMVGHSIGGASAAETMHDDPRIDAGADLDGTFFAPVEPLDRPFLLLGAGAHGPGGVDDSWDRTWERLHGWKRWITLNGSGHSTAIDLSVLADQLGIERPGEPLSGARGTELGDRYVAAFLDRHLRGLPQPVLDGPTEQNPEALFWHQD
ncbi:MULTISPECIES: alpha/beta hydrolase [unclassified Saccharopolyspora]|uniref:alpha/beta hydrolase family protein n=1 Tax=unclassified Saccharopolyspora TaxID=2646250 RepID=UPI001CD49603|nr:MULTISPECIES: alpha/beta hydrolase [unclassified Saccharopolyspora]MCA1187939.1 alpha/beta hydrolase [Saccharopolyspora sp. 6T]MCA1194941.1 alpha/beta hydrolase [Saccharopolyspora sp. 6V]MCA1226382.1 alpha/beta hydrolase [Saccharopolyspora sp. 6M]MCA1279133.1 alpha/beta hydrolase [Saccharopolyspora sp. 7B]